MSRPARKVTRPKMTAICINKDFLLLNSRAAEPDKSSGKPRMDGISEVKDRLSLIMLTKIPKSTKNKPITKVIFSAL
jgi:hypothetical protein|tara:strand:+ start:188 stop:418 length:231 start_codon:yes stop_codon:yes gene_type:complete